MGSEKFSGVCQDGALAITSSSDVFLLQEIIPDTAPECSSFVCFVCFIYVVDFRFVS